MTTPLVHRITIKDDEPASVPFLVYGDTVKVLILMEPFEIEYGLLFPPLEEMEDSATFTLLREKDFLTPETVLPIYEERDDMKGVWMTDLGEGRLVPCIISPIREIFDEVKVDLAKDRMKRYFQLGVSIRKEKADV